MATRTLSKNIISRYCNNFAIVPSRSAWKVCINIPEKKIGMNGVDVWRENRKQKIHRQVLASSTQPQI